MATGRQAISIPATRADNAKRPRKAEYDRAVAVMKAVAAAVREVKAQPRLRAAGRHGVDYTIPGWIDRLVATIRRECCSIETAAKRVGFSEASLLYRYLDRNKVAFQKALEAYGLDTSPDDESEKLPPGNPGQAPQDRRNE